MNQLSSLDQDIFLLASTYDTWKQKTTDEYMSFVDQHITFLQGTAALDYMRYPGAVPTIQNITNTLVQTASDDQDTYSLVQPASLSEREAAAKEMIWAYCEELQTAEMTLVDANKEFDRRWPDVHEFLNHNHTKRNVMWTAVRRFKEMNDNFRLDKMLGDMDCVHREIQIGMTWVNNLP